MSLRRILATVSLCILAISTLQAQDPTPPYWRLLEDGKVLFDKGQYGDALLSFEDAVRTRKGYYEKLGGDLVQVLSLADFRRLGDSLDAVEKLLGEKKLEDAAQALRVAKNASKSRLNGSASAALDTLNTLRDYPEAEYWIGEVFRVEGENDLAIGQYNKAWEHRANLDVPDDAVHFLYAEADILLDKGNYQGREEILGRIIDLYPLWLGSGSSFAKSAMERTLRDEGIDALLRLYRVEPSLALDAYRELGLYYYSTGRHDRATTALMAAALISSSVLLDTLGRQGGEFVYTSLADALNLDRNLRPSNPAVWRLRAYLDQVDYYGVLYYLGSSLFAQGYRRSAEGLWRVIGSSKQAGDWATRAKLQLLHPTIEAPLERP